MDQIDNRLEDINEFWLISAPGDKTPHQTWELLNNVTAKQNNLSVNFKFHIPDLKVSFLSLFLHFTSCSYFIFLAAYLCIAYYDTGSLWKHVNVHYCSDSFHNYFVVIGFLNLLHHYGALLVNTSLFYFLL